MKKLLQRSNLKVKFSRRIVKGGHIIIRKLSSKGEILVKVGDYVKPEDIVAEGTRVSGFRSVHLAESLGVAARNVLKYLKVRQGDSVYPDQILATRRRFLKEINIRSPIEGIISEYNLQTGNLLIKYAGSREKLTAACWGEVKRISKNTAIEIETNVLKILGVEGAGHTREGEFLVFIKPNDFLLPELITIRMAGKIIFGGARITKAALGKAVSLGVAGIITGGIHLDDFFRVGGAKRGPQGLSSDVGTTLVILEGFGLRPVNDKIYAELVENNGKFAIIDGDEAEIIFPQTLKDVVPAVQREELDEKDLEVGDTVRLLDPVNLGLTGKVIKLPQRKEALSVGIKNFLVEIKTSSGKIIQPVNNLEVLV